MTTRGLSWTALGLALLLGGATWLTLDRLGLLEELPVPDFVFRNHVLDVERGRRIILRPMQEGPPTVRYTFTGTEAEPEVSEKAFFPAPYVVTGMEDRKPDEDAWYFKDYFFLVLGQMGAMTPKEWLEEIGLVRERSRDGTERLLVRALYGHESGATVVYYYDPERPVPGVGWFRSEMHAQDRDPEVHFARDAGRIDLK
ncbi:MAG: hypothetical protein ACYTF8_11220 [Planctomycetota bacterium]|jgi:hypothetical protein